MTSRRCDREPSPQALESIRGQGDAREKAFRELLRAWEPIIAGQARRLAPVRGEIDDYEQIGRLALLRAAERYQPGPDHGFEKFARRVLRNALLDERLRARRRPIHYVGALPLEPEGNDTVLGQLLRSERCALVQRELRQWSQRYQEIVDLLYRQGYKQAEVARILGRTKARVSQLLDEIRAKGHRSFATIEID